MFGIDRRVISIDDGDVVHVRHGVVHRRLRVAYRVPYRRGNGFIPLTSRARTRVVHLTRQVPVADAHLDVVRASVARTSDEDLRDGAHAGELSGGVEDDAVGGGRVDLLERDARGGHRGLGAAAVRAGRGGHDGDDDGGGI